MFVQFQQIAELSEQIKYGLKQLESIDKLDLKLLDHKIHKVIYDIINKSIHPRHEKD